MKTYKFNTKITANGTIDVPLHAELYNRDVEVIIIPKTTELESSNYKAADFINQWTGFLTGGDNKDLRYNYLMNKYK